MNDWEKKLNPELRKAEDLFNYLTECRIKEEIPFLTPRFHEESIKEMQEYFAQNPNSSKTKIANALKKIEPEIKIPKYFILHIKDYFTKKQ